jgi:deoxyribodipyrimidine photo-lyase
VYRRLGNDIWRDIEPARTGVRNYAQDLPADIESGTTGATCIDSFAHDLHETGYLHNHARMWTAAYVVHHRRVRWQAGARWFLQHLLDGDPASNNLSWQWVASTFAAKPYFFNRENLARYTENVYCERCPLARGGCPFDGSYEDVAERIFPSSAAQVTQEGPGQSDLTRRLATRNDEDDEGIEAGNVQADAHLLWLHEENLSPYNPALSAHPHGLPIFIFDEQAIEAAKWTLKRIAFIYESLLEIPSIRIYRGSPTEIIPRLLMEQRANGKTKVAMATTPATEPRLQQQQHVLAKFAPLLLYPIEPFAPIRQVRDLRRFSRYWNDVEQAVVWGKEKAGRGVTFLS